jgi:FK506-binding protein 14
MTAITTMSSPSFNRLFATITLLVGVCISILLLASTTTVVAEEGGLQISTTYMPDTCDVKSKNGDKLFMHYTGYIDDSSMTGVKGKKFDSSIGRKPFDFILGAGRVIKGWDAGLQDMCVGEKRTLTIPSELGYGERGAGNDIPGMATLRFDVELLQIKDPTVKTPARNIFGEMDADKDRFISNSEFEGWFTSQKKDVPRGAWEKEDKDGDRRISFEEFSGPKSEL